MPVLLRSVRLRMPPAPTLPHEETHEGARAFGASAPGGIPPSFETRTRHFLTITDALER